MSKGTDQAKRAGRVVRRDPRHLLHRFDVGLLVGDETFRMWVHNLSRSGLCGLTDAPVAARQLVRVVLEGEKHIAQVRWVRNRTTGLVLFSPLEQSLVLRLARRTATENEGD